MIAILGSSSFRRLMVRDEYYGHLCDGLIHLASIRICLRTF